jgi:DivIVA domain-containing protein
MPLHPEDVVRKSFTSGRFRGGYNEGEVDAFLEEVMIELRRLYARIDELEADAIRRDDAAELDEGESERLRIERQQLELIRRERASLVLELQELQSSTETARADEVGRPTLDDPAGEPNAYVDDLQQQVAELKAELHDCRRDHLAYRQQVIVMAREHLRAIEADGVA